MDLMTIGAFASRTRLSPKALRLYDQLGLLPPAHTDPANGYRFYSDDQVERARLVGLLRRLDMPLDVIAGIVAKPSAEAADAVGHYWAQVESVIADRKVLVSYIQARLTGDDMSSYDVQIRTVPERKLLTIGRHLYLPETAAFFGDAFARLRAAAPGLTGVAGYPFLVFYGDVSEDTDPRAVAAMADVQLRTESGHDEAFIRLAKKDMAWPAMQPAVDALERWLTEQRREAAGPLRQVLIADQRTAAPETPVCDLSVPLASRTSAPAR